jgi:hypothetical protein
MAHLTEDRTILFDSVSEFLNQYKSHISKGGFYVTSEVDWPLRTPTDFNVRITETEAGAGITAEVVYCDDGKVGLQMAPNSSGVKAMADLDEELRGGPVLVEDGAVLYRSVVAFLADFEANIISGGFYVRSQFEWTIGESRNFFIRVDGLGVDLPFWAKPVFAEGGMVSLQIEHTKENIAGLNEFVTALRQIRVEQKKAEAAIKITPVLPKFDSFQGTAVATQDAKEFAAVESVDLHSDEGDSPTLFTLFASLAEVRQPVSLLLESNGDRFTFQFNTKGKIVGFTGPRSEVNILERLTRAGYLDQDVCDQLRMLLADGNAARDLVIEHKACTQQQVFLIFREQVLDALEKSRKMGQVRFLIDTKPTNQTEGIRFDQLILPWMERALKSVAPKQIKAMLRPIWENNPRVNDTPHWTLNQLDMSDAEYSFIKSLDGSISVKKSISSIDKKERDQKLRLIISLKSLGTLEIEETDRPVRKKVKKSAQEQRLEELVEELKHLEEGNIFDQAGVHWSAHPSSFQLATQQINMEYGRSSGLARSSPEAASLCQRRVEIAKMAMIEVKNTNKRKFHREQVVPNSMLQQSAKLLFTKAEQHIVENKLPEAVEFLEMAVELDPKPEYLTKLENVRGRVPK